LRTKRWASTAGGIIPIPIYVTLLAGFTYTGEIKGENIRHDRGPVIGGFTCAEIAKRLTVVKDGVASQDRRTLDRGAADARRQRVPRLSLALSIRVSMAYGFGRFSTRLW
jgi:hypothetical protein